MTSEQQDLLLKARESLDAARLLAEKSFYDFSVSRAYYTMFYVTQALLLGEGLAFSKHSAVIAAFGKHFTKTGRVSPEFHRYLIDGEDLRHVGDYDVKSRLSKEDADMQIRSA